MLLNLYWSWMMVIVLTILLRTQAETPYVPANPVDPSVRWKVIDLLKAGNGMAALKLLQASLKPDGSLDDGLTPSLWHYAGLATHMLDDLEAAEKAYAKAIRFDRQDIQSWMNFGEVLLYQWKGELAIAAFDEALRAYGGRTKAPTAVLAKLHRAHSWTASWARVDELRLELRKRIAAALNKGSSTDSSRRLFQDSDPRHVMTPADFDDLPLRHSTELAPSNKNANAVPKTDRTIIDHAARLHERRRQERELDRAAPEEFQRPILFQNYRPGERPLHIGFLSSDFGVHPVSSLVRGLLTTLDGANFEGKDDSSIGGGRKKSTNGKGLSSNAGEFFVTLGNRQRRAVDVSCWMLSDQDSWWRRNLTGFLGGSRGRFISLHGLAFFDAAKRIAASGVDILVDLNGHTKGSGLPIMRHRPAPVQVSFLGFPATSGAAFIDFYICDPVAAEPATVARDGFTENLALLPRGVAYIVNDHAQMHGHILDLEREQRLRLRETFPAKGDNESIDFIFAERRLRREFSGLQRILVQKRRDDLEALALFSGDDTTNKTTKSPEDKGKDINFREEIKRISRGPLEDEEVVLASFSNWNKMDPITFSVWAAVLRRVPKASLWLQKYDLGDLAISNLEAELRAQGVFAGKSRNIGSTSEIYGVEECEGVDQIQAACANSFLSSNLTTTLKLRGSRLFTTERQPWIYHVQAKAAADLMLDTPQKNMHTTSLDSIFAGVPLVTMAGDRVSKRAGISNLNSLFSGPEDGNDRMRADFKSAGRVFSFKEYEDIAVKLASDPRRLMRLRDEFIKRRTMCGGLFDTKSYSADFLSLAHTMLEAKENFPNLFDDEIGSKEGANRANIREGEPLELAGGVTPWRKGAVWMSERSRSSGFDLCCRSNGTVESVIRTYSGLQDLEGARGTSSRTVDGDSSREQRYSTISTRDDGKPFLLNIGGSSTRADWLIVNILSSGGAAGQLHGLTDGADIVAPMDNLSMFDDSTVTAIYASHVLEHASYRYNRNHSYFGKKTDERIAGLRARLGDIANGEVMRTLLEWHRVLKAGGALFVSVPDLDVLVRLYQNETLSISDRFFVMRMIYGGQVDEHDFHYTGFDEDLLAQLLRAAGFCEVRRVDEFGLYDDTSVMKKFGVPISLNVAATACKFGPDGKPTTNRIYVSIMDMRQP